MGGIYESRFVRLLSLQSGRNGSLKLSGNTLGPQKAELPKGFGSGQEFLVGAERRGILFHKRCNQGNGLSKYPLTLIM